jgi:hypothetical protein
MKPEELTIPVASTPELAPEALLRKVAAGLIWRCGQCGYQRWSIVRPHTCPACALPGDEFIGLSAVEWRQRLADQAASGIDLDAGGAPATRRRMFAGPRRHSGAPRN